MGYTTDFSGQFDCTPTLQPEHADYLKQFAETRRMKRDAEKASLLLDPIREAVELPIGKEGCNFVGGDGYAGQDHDDSILEYNQEPKGQPGLWCQWVPNKDGTAIEWDGNEKFYFYIEWIEYLVENYLAPWGYVLNGEVIWTGEEPSDIGKINIIDNKIEILHGEIVYK